MLATCILKFSIANAVWRSGVHIKSFFLLTNGGSGGRDLSARAGNFLCMLSIEPINNFSWDKVHGV